MNDIKVLGLTSSQEFYIGSKDRNFRINEYLIVEDSFQGDLISEVMEANTYNRYIPLNIGGDIADDDVLKSLEAIGYIVDDETIYIAKCRLMNEADYPVKTGSSVREPVFEEIKSYLINSSKETGLLLGAIKNTDGLYEDMDSELKGLYHILEEELHEQKDVPFYFNINEMNQYPHIGVFGGSGSGKSYGLRVLLEELMKKGIPTIIFDPHFEMDFDLNEDNPSSKESYQGYYNIYHVGRDTGIDFRDLDAYELKNLLSSSGELTEAMDSTVDVLFRHYGKNKAVDVNTFEKLISDLIAMKEIGNKDKIIELELNAVGEEKEYYGRLAEYYERYDRLTNDKTLRGLSWRVSRLKNEGVFSKDSNNVLNTLENGMTCVIRGSTRLLQVYGSYLIRKLYMMRRNYKDSGSEYFPPFIIVTDEAHEFAPKGVSKPSKSVLREIAQEGRKYGVFLILATQRPTLLDETITAQLNSKFIFRTVRGTDIQTIREETDITSEEAKRLPYLKTGDMFASVASMGRTIFSRVRASETIKPHVENPFDELKNKNKIEDEKFLDIIDKFYPIGENDFIQIISELENDGIKMSLGALKNKLEVLARRELVIKEEGLFGETYKKKGV